MSDYPKNSHDIPLITTEPVGSEEFIVNMGPQHPSTHGVCRLLLKMDGEVIVEAVPIVGYLHRALEKIADNTARSRSRSRRPR